MPAGRKTYLHQGYNPKTGIWKEDSIGGQVIAALRVGNFVKHAAAYAGVHERAVQGWLAKGRQYTEPADNLDELLNLETVPEKHRIYVHFVQKSTHARAASVVDLIALMGGHAITDWRAADRLLTFIDPEHFQPKSHHVHTGKGGGPIEVTGTAVMNTMGKYLEPSDQEQQEDGAPADDE